MVTIKDIEKRLEHHQRLDLAGVGRSGQNLGPIVILYTRQRRTHHEDWEVLPQWIADLVIADMHNRNNIDRAAVYHRIPANAPMDIARTFLKAKMLRAATYSEAWQISLTAQAA